MNNSFLHGISQWFEEFRETLSFDETARREIMALEQRVKFLEDEVKILQSTVLRLDIAMIQKEKWFS